MAKLEASSYTGLGTVVLLSLKPIKCIAGVLKALIVIIVHTSSYVVPTNTGD